MELIYISLPLKEFKRFERRIRKWFPNTFFFFFKMNFEIRMRMEFKKNLWIKD